MNYFVETRFFKSAY